MPGRYLPYRGSGAGLPEDLPLPPGPMPSWRGGRPLKRWRYVAAFGEQAMLCVGVAHVGPAATSWWAVWDRGARRLCERTRRSAGRGRVSLADDGRVLVADGDVAIDLRVEHGAGVETVCPHGEQYVWTRKQAARPVRGTVRVGDRAIEIDALAVVDETAGYHARRTAWWWAAGVGELADGRVAGWNLVAGVNDPPRGSERSVWVDGAAHEVGPVAFAADLSSVSFAEGGTLRFAAEAQRARRDRLLLVRSDYRQPFGTVEGDLPGAGALRAGMGVMERHVARW